MQYIKSLVWKFLNYLNKYIASPRMIVGYTTIDGKYLAKTRISNTVSITATEHLTIADNVFIWHHTILECSNGLTIDEGCQIGANVLIATHSSHLAIRLYGKHYLEHKHHIAYVRGAVKVGKYCFIGPYVTIMPDCQIGHGSIVAAYSLVKAGVYPDFAILAGNPAQVVGDTRTLDAKYLAEHKDLRNYYDEWAQNHAN